MLGRERDAALACHWCDNVLQPDERGVMRCDHCDHPCLLPMKACTKCKRADLRLDNPKGG